MELTVPVNHNFHEELPILESQLTDAFSEKKAAARKIQEIFSSVHELKLGADQLKHVRVFGFKRKRLFEPDDDRLILKLYLKQQQNEESKYFVQTGLYAGSLYYKGCKFNITTKYGDAFLKRMLNFVNDIYVDNQKSPAKREGSTNEFLYILAYLFVQTLEKAALLGLPQEYKMQRERTHKVRGTIDFNAYLKQDIPFQGKLTVNFREQRYIQEIVDVLFLALRKLERIFGKDIHNKLLGLYQLLKLNYSGRYSSYEAIQKAKNHHALHNPLYTEFRKVIDYAEMILMDQDLIAEDHQNKLETFGFLFDISELFELYLEKMLRRSFNCWAVSGQEQLNIYMEKFFARRMLPDLVMRHKATNKIVVFDAKFKNMGMNHKDVDRDDLFQIHSYMAYYNPEVVAGGLLYPLSSGFRYDRSHSNTLFGIKDNETKFIIDGIQVDERMSAKDLIESEKEFINRISQIVGKF